MELIDQSIYNLPIYHYFFDSIEKMILAIWYL